MSSKERHIMTTNQLELGFNGTQSRIHGRRRETRVTRAKWWFAKMRAADMFIYLDDVQYEKREFQNRNRIRTPRGWQYLTAPVISKGRFSQKINEVELDNAAGWQQDHLQAIKLNYARAPYYKDYAPAIEELYSRGYRLLADLSIATMDFLRKASA